jgi:hypothetical protein
MPTATWLGGDGNDTFRFVGGHDLITDFHAGTAGNTDRISLRGADLAIQNFEQLMDPELHIVSEEQGNTILTFNENNSITLVHISSSDLLPGQFLFPIAGA